MSGESESLQIDGWREGGFVVSRKLMKTNARSNVRFIAIAVALVWVAIVSAATATTPQYQIYDIGVIDPGDDASQGFGVSHGGIAVGRSIRTGGSQAFSWTLQGGIVGLPNLAGRNHAVANSANEQVVVGTAATTFFGSDRLPIKWLEWSRFAAAVAAGRDARRRELGELFRYCGRLCGCRKQPAGRSLPRRRR